jgi:hypothetical protein
LSDEASERDSHSRARRVRGAAGRAVLLLLALLGAYLVMATFVLHGHVNPWSLLQSVSGAAGSAAVIGPPCESVGSKLQWTCTVISHNGSGSGRYRVSVHHQTSCWDAVLVRDLAADTMPKNLSGCVRRIEQAF